MGNQTSRNGNSGIAAGAMRRAVIDWNTADRNGFGMNAEDTGLFFFDLNDSEIAHNTASRNVVGIDLFGGPQRFLSATAWSTTLQTTTRSSAS